MLLDIFTQIFGENYIWQDLVIAIVSLLFGFILIPQLKDVWKKDTILNIYTAGLTTLGLYVLGITFSTMNLWLSVISEFFSATVWLLLFILSLKNKVDKKD